MNTMIAKESVLDFPKDDLNPKIWTKDINGNYVLNSKAEQVVQAIVDWAQQTFKIPEMRVNLTGSNTSNSYSNNSDLDIHFNSPHFKKEKADDFNKVFRQKFEKFIAQHPELGNIDGIKTEVYMQANPFQDMMSVGCYDFLGKRWLVGPEFKDIDFDPYAEYFTKDMKHVDDVIDDVRLVILKIYELAIALLKTKDQGFKQTLAKKLKPLVSQAAKIFNEIRAKRSHKSAPQNAEDALKSRDDKDWKIADSAFKLLDKFGYLGILRACAQNVDRFSEDMSDIEIAMKTIVSTIGEKISAEALNDSEKMFAGKILEYDQQNESIGTMIRLSTIAALMSIGSLLPADSLAKELHKAKQEASVQGQKLTKDSKLAKAAVNNAAMSKEMIGSLSKPNAVNALAQVLWKEARGEGSEGLNAVASVIWNRAGGQPKWLIDVIKQKQQFSCLNNYVGGWTNGTYKWYNPDINELKNPSSMAIWNLCKSIALSLANGDFKSTIGNRNVYANAALSDKKNVDSWIKDCDLSIGRHRFGYRREYDPTIVKPGTFTSWKKLKKSSGKFVVVKPGDTLGKIAHDNSTSIEQLLKLNRDITNPSKIKVGQKINI